MVENAIRVCPEEILTADRRFLTEKISDLPTRLLTGIDRGLRLILDLEKRE